MKDDLHRIARLDPVTIVVMTRAVIGATHPKTCPQIERNTGRGLFS